MITMEVKQIAALKAETLNRLSNWGRYSSLDDGSYDPRSTAFSGKLDNERREFIKCDTMATMLAMSRARETNRDYETALMEVQLEVGIELARILAESIDPAFAGTNAVKIEEDGQVCGVCQEDMEKGEEARAMANCSHKFHDFCIFEWVKRKTNCPLCRRQMETRKYYEF